ncbi:protein ABHD18 isoform X2 [Neocloeon triangulifer]|uniref:protein ABHD18 isoform X2 n=1 Tax=Neocloeon triangulifer TaxID=2078957 RepID=UPI00286F1973|nr:protein ABHD18 isoform X2 [Neocloeon triangulifer]
MQPISRLDQVYRSLVLSKFFVKGWGKPENIKRLFEFRKVVCNRESCYKLVPPDYPVKITKEEVASDHTLLEGNFVSPFVHHLPGILPQEAELAHFQVVLPKEWKDPNYKPMCIHMAGTGDHFFWRRRAVMAKPLLKEAGIGGIILENPFYGSRRPKEQLRSSLLNVSDIFVMGGCLMLEALVLLHWCERNGLGPLGLTGMSMGGHMASISATNWPKPVVLVPCLSWSTASTVFTKGVMSAAIDWSMLEAQYMGNEQYRQDIRKMLSMEKDDAFRAGQHFAQSYPATFSRINNLDVSTSQDDSDSDAEQQAQAVAASTGGKSQLSMPSVLAGFHLSKKNLVKGKDEGKKKTQDEVYQFMRGIMDECTHLKNFSVPVDTELIIAIAALEDAYVPRDNCTHLQDIWPGASIRFLKGGHVSSFVLYLDTFRKAVIEGFELYKQRYPKPVK